MSTVPWNTSFTGENVSRKYLAVTLTIQQENASNVRINSFPPMASVFPIILLMKTANIPSFKGKDQAALYLAARLSLTSVALSAPAILDCCLMVLA